MVGVAHAQPGHEDDDVFLIQVMIGPKSDADRQRLDHILPGMPAEEVGLPDRRP